MLIPVFSWSKKCIKYSNSEKNNYYVKRMPYEVYAYHTLPNGTF